jgi:hypothetical protein
MATEAKYDNPGPADRRWRRSHLKVPVRVTIDKSRDDVIDTLCFRINNGGLAVRTDRELRLGDEAEIRFTPPHFYPFVRLRGIVRNRDGDLYGVEFQATTAAEEKQLALFRQILARWTGQG